VDILQTAIAKNRKVSCRYYEWAIDLQSRLFERRWRHGDHTYCISPYTMIWDSENYYLAAFDSEAGIIKHYRVDKMANLEILNETRDGHKQFEALDMAQYTKSTFGMFGGAETAVTLRFTNRLVGVVVDRFGKDVLIQKADSDHFTITVQAIVSPQFISWVLGFGAEVEVLRPQSVIDELQNTLQSVKTVYEK
jgi:predicted DNA-binding transcriptional regulator YafY